MSKKRTARDRTKRIGGFDVSNYLPGTYGQNPATGTTLSRVLKAETDRLANEAERISLETYVASQRRRLDSINRGGQPVNFGVGGVNPAVGKFIESYMTDPKARKQWDEMEPAQRMVLTSSVAAMSQQGGAMNMNMMMPFMMAQMQSNPRSSMKDMVELIGVVNQIQGGNKGGGEAVAMLTAMMPLLLENRKTESQGGSAWKDVLDIAKEFSKSNADYLKSELARERNAPTLADQLVATKALAEAMGMAQGAKPDMELERLKMDFQKTMSDTQWNREIAREKSRADIANSKARMKAMEKVGMKALERAAPLIDGLSKSLTARGQNPTSPPQQVANTVQPQATPQQAPNAFLCDDCGATISVVGDPETVACPNADCGKTFMKQAPKG